MEQIKEYKKIKLPKYKLNQRIFFLEKLNSSNSQKNLIQSKIREYFFSPENYFKEKSNVLINKRINIKKITPIGNLSTNIKTNLTKTNTYKEKILSISNNNINKDSSLEKEPQNKHFEKINKERLKDIFFSFKNAKHIRKKNILNNNYIQNNSYNCNIPKQLSVNLASRIRKLNELEKENSKNENTYSQNYLFKWVSSLRRPKIFEGKMVSYLNVGNNINPLWSTAIEKYPDTKEITVKVGVNSDLNKKDEKDRMNSYKYKKVGDLEKISITGKKLYDIEYKREMSSNCSRILHKSFIDNGKVIMYKDVNNLFGHETIYKNYSGRNHKEHISFPLGSQSVKNINQSIK